MHRQIFIEIYTRQFIYMYIQLSYKRIALIVSNTLVGPGKGHKKELHACSQGRCAHARSKGKLQRMKKAHGGRTNDCLEKERKAWKHARGKQLERDIYGIHIMVVYDGVILQLRTYEKIFVIQDDSASFQVMITTVVAIGVVDGDG